MKYLVACVVWFGLVIAWSTGTGLAADKVNYSGRYSLQMLGNSPASDLSWTLDVMQNPDSIEITWLEKDKTMHCRCPLNGSEGDYTGRAGIPGKCKAHLKGDSLVVEWNTMTAPPDPRPMHGKEQWQLSADSKTLTIKSETYMPKGISIVMNEKYTRTENR